MQVFLFGFGYITRSLALKLASQDPSIRISGTARDGKKRQELTGSGFNVYRDLTKEGAQQDLSHATHLFLSAPPGDNGDPFLRWAQAVDFRFHTKPWIAYLSSTSVYGDHEGAWVTENSETKARNTVGSQRIEAEQTWVDYARDHSFPLACFRLSGIYGPGRSAFDSLRQGHASRIDKPGHVFSRIHRDDAVLVLEKALLFNLTGIYNLADDEPAASAEVMAYAANLLGCDPPPLLPYDKAELSPSRTRFYDASRRIDNRRVKQALNWHPRYPNYRDGLEAILKEEKILHSFQERSPPALL